MESLEEYQEETKRLIETAKKMSKDRFLFFASNAFNIPPETFEHLWKVPIVDYNEIIRILTDAVPEDKKEESRKHLETRLKDDIGEQEAVFINIDELIDDLKDNIETGEYSKLLTELQKVLESKDYNALIIYDYNKLEKERREFEFEAKEENIAKQDVQKAVLKRFAEIFLHELCHLNSNVLLALNQDEAITVNGVSEKPGRVSNYMLIEKMKNYNEVMVDTLAQIINNYATERNIDRSLEKIIKQRDGTSQYDKFDDTFILSLYAVFTEEMIEWMLVGAYGDISNNILKEKIAEVTEGFVPENEDEFSEELEVYSDKQVDVEDYYDLELLEKVIHYFETSQKSGYSPSRRKLREAWLRNLQGLEDFEEIHEIE